MKLKLFFKKDGGDKNIYNNQELDLGLKLKNLDFLGLIDNMKKTNQENINMIKASETKNYYKKINHINKSNKSNKSNKLNKLKFNK